MTREQIQRMYKTKMEQIVQTIARDKKKKEDADREAIQKRNKLYGDISASLSVAGMTKDLFEWRQGKLLDKRYKEDENILGALTPFKKYKEKEDRPFMEVLKDPIESAIRLTPRGSLEETEGYKEFQVLEDLKTSKSGVKPESLMGEIDPTTKKQITGKGWDALIKSREIETDLAKMDIANVDNAIFKKHGITKEDAQELVNVLEGKGITLGERVFDPDTGRFVGALDQEQVVKLLSEYDKTIQDTVKSEAFEEVLRKAQTPEYSVLLDDVVTDLTENTDKTLNAVIEGTYAPGQKPTGKLTYDEWMASEDPDGDLQINPYSGNITKKTIGEGYAMDELGADSDVEAGLDFAQKPYVPGADATEYYARETASALDKLRIEAGDVEADRAPTVPAPPDYEKIEAGANLSREMQKETAGGIGAMNWRDIRETSEKAPEVSEDDPIFQSMQEGWEAGADQAGQEAAPMLASAGPLSDAPIDVSADVTTDVEVPDVKPGDVEVPDAKTGLGRFTGKAFNAAQTGQQIFNIGKTITDEDASDEDRAVAGTQGAKMLADLATKHAGQETVAQIGSKALTKKGYEQLTKEGVKLGGKAAVGTGLGAVLGGYTMITEGGEAVESWEEGDYDEAILHGISSVSGGLQTAGAGMMLTGIGAPLGAVLFGVGTAASAISSGAQLLEGLFGGDGGGGVLPEVKKPKFNAARYLDSIRSGYAY